MSKVSLENAPDVTDYGPAEDRGAQLDRYAVVFSSIREDWDLTPLLKGLPGDSCQCPHWGYVTAGRLTVRYGDREEVIEPGDAFYMPPGHVPAAVAGTELVMFSPQGDLAAMEAAMRENMQLRIQENGNLSPSFGRRCSVQAGDPALRPDPAGRVIFGAAFKPRHLVPAWLRDSRTAGFERASGRRPPGHGGCARAGDEIEDNSCGGV